MFGLIGVLAIIQGFGSAIAKIFFDRPTFGILTKWAGDYQPYAGICIGLAGIGLVALGERLKA
jgi:hypothetical protein